MNEQLNEILNDAKINCRQYEKYKRSNGGMACEYLITTNRLLKKYYKEGGEGEYELKEYVEKEVKFMISRLKDKIKRLED